VSDDIGLAKPFTLYYTLFSCSRANFVKPLFDNRREVRVKVSKGQLMASGLARNGRLSILFPFQKGLKILALLRNSMIRILKCI
jgi:hypothetical protein